jgi:Flp pilus assembly protein TadG
MTTSPGDEGTNEERAVSDRLKTTRARGQIIVVFALAIVAVIGMVGLVIDGGAAFAQQRVAQNGADGTATAGTVVVAENLSGQARTGADVQNAITVVGAANGLEDITAEYTDDFGQPIGVAVDAATAIPDTARGVRVAGNRAVPTTFARVLGFTEFTASAEATVVAGKSSGECVLDEDGCTLLPVTFPVTVSQCDSSGVVIPGGTWIGAPPPPHQGEEYWPIVGEEELPGSATYPTGNPATLAILPLCKSSGESSGTFGWLDLVAGMNLRDEIEGPLTETVDLPDWFQTQTGNANSVEDELNAYIHQPVLIPLHNNACQEDPGDTEVCSRPGVDPAGNNTWYYVHTLAVFYIDQVLVQSSDVDECTSAPGSPLVPVTTGAGFMGCLKGWFVNYVTAGPIIPGGEITPGTALSIQLIK